MREETRSKRAYLHTLRGIHKVRLRWSQSDSNWRFFCPYCKRGLQNNDPLGEAFHCPHCRGYFTVSDKKEGSRIGG